MKTQRIVKEACVECPFCKGKGYYNMTSEFLRSLVMKEGNDEMKVRFEKLVKLQEINKLDTMSLREIGLKIGVKHAQSVKHTIARAKMLGYIK